jgi:hypothetical protein
MQRDQRRARTVGNFPRGRIQIVTMASAANRIVTIAVEAEDRRHPPVSQCPYTRAP